MQRLTRFISSSLSRIFYKSFEKTNDDNTHQQHPTTKSTRHRHQSHYPATVRLLSNQPRHLVALVKSRKLPCSSSRWTYPALGC